MKLGIVVVAAPFLAAVAIIGMSLFMRLVAGPNAGWRLSAVTACFAVVALLLQQWVAAGDAAVASLLIASIELGFWR